MALFIWLIVALLFFLVELISVSLFYFLSFACAALITAVVSFWLGEPWHQILVFCAMVVAFFVLFKWLLHPKRYRHHATNVDALVGKRGVVIKTIAPHITGQAKIDGHIWSARALGAETILQGGCIEVLRVQGCHVIVKEITS